MDKLRAFIDVKFVMGYHKLPNLQSYWETGSLKESRKFWAISTFQTMKMPFLEITKPTIGHLM